MSVGALSHQLNGLIDHSEPLNYMRSNGAALLVAAVDAVDQQQQQHIQAPTRGSRSQFFCDQCDMVFGSKSAHTSHMKSHLKYTATGTTVAVPVEATGNGAEGNFSASAAPGVGGGGSGDPYQCDKCNKTFAVPARLVS